MSTKKTGLDGKSGVRYGGRMTRPKVQGDKTLGIRLTDDVLERVDAVIEEVSKVGHGSRVSRTEMARALLLEALEAAERKSSDKRGKR